MIRKSISPYRREDQKLFFVLPVLGHTCACHIKGTFPITRGRYEPTKLPICQDFSTTPLTAALLNGAQMSAGKV